jgi:hypothetical protein
MFRGMDALNALCDPQISLDAKHKFYITCLDALFMETKPGPPKHEKWSINVSCTGHTGRHYVTHRSHRMHKHKFDITCLDALIMETARGPPEHEK